MKSSKEMLLEAWSLFKSHWGMFLVLLLAPTIGNAVIQYLIVPGILMAGVPLGDFLGGSASMGIVLQIIGVILIVVCVLAIMILSIIGPFLLLQAAKQYHEGQPVQFKALLKDAWKRFFPYLWIVILLYAVLFAGTVLLIIPVFFFFIWFLFAYTANVIDNKKGLQAFVYSKSLINGRAWEVISKLLFLLVIGLIYYAICIVVVILAAVLFNVSATVGLVVIIPIGIILLAFGLCFGCVCFIYLYLMYKELTRTAAVAAPAEGAVEGAAMPVDANAVLPVPTWLKIITWFGGILLVGLLLLYIGIFALNPAFRQEFINQSTHPFSAGSAKYNESKKAADALNGSASADAEAGIYNDYGVRFSYPSKEGWTYAGRGQNEASFAFFFDEKTKVGAEGSEVYGAVVDVEGFVLNEDSVNKSAYEFTNESFGPYLKDAKAESKIESYTIKKETIKGQEVGVVEYTEATPDGKAQGRWIFIKHDNLVYAFLAQALSAHYAATTRTLAEMVNTLEFTATPEAPSN